MTTDTRIPSIEITGFSGGLVKMAARRMLGDVPESAGLMWHYPAVFKDVMRFGRKTDKWNRLDPNLASFAAMAAAATVGCGFCLDFGYFMAHNKRLDEVKAREVPRWRESEVFTPLERTVMGYAEAMSRTPPAVTDEMSAALLAELGAPALVELTTRVGAMNLTARGNVALGIRSQEFSAACGLRPLATPLGAGRRLGMSDDPFLAHRSLLFTVAYEMLGSATDAEDVVQESWLRWAAVDRTGVRDPRAFLVRVVTRKALDRLRTLARRREDYVGPWLPEPFRTAPDVAEDVELAESLSMAMLLVLETLTPAERAVFVLREVFDLGYDELAGAVGKSPAAVRQIAHRARAHVAARRPREVVSPTETRAAFEAFMHAVETGDLQRLVDVLAPDVVALSDGGGVKKALPQPVVGAGNVARVLVTGLRRYRASVEPTQLNGWPALILRLDGELDSVVALRFDNGLVTGLYSVRNPEKLSRVATEVAVSR